MQNPSKLQFTNTIESRNRTRIKRNNLEIHVSQIRNIDIHIRPITKSAEARWSITCLPKSYAFTRTYRHHLCRISWRLPWTRRSDRRWADPPLLIFSSLTFRFLFVCVLISEWRIERRRRKKKRVAARKRERTRIYRITLAIKRLLLRPGLGVGSYLLTRTGPEITITLSLFSKFTLVPLTMIFFDGESSMAGVILSFKFDSSHF